jgi:hypothetical protein
MTIICTMWEHINIFEVFINLKVKKNQYFTFIYLQPILYNPYIYASRFIFWNLLCILKIWFLNFIFNIEFKKNYTNQWILNNNSTFNTSKATYVYFSFLWQGSPIVNFTIFLPPRYTYLISRVTYVYR